MTSYTFSQLIDFTRTSSGTFTDSTGKIASTPASKNLLTFTQEFDNAAWTKSGATVTANTTTAPDGTSTADKVTATAATGYHGVYCGAAAAAGVSYVASYYAKAAEYSKVYIADGANGRFAAAFDLAAGTAGATTGSGIVSTSITSVGDGWYRCAVVYTGLGVSVAPSVSGYPNSGATLNQFGVQYTGDGTSGIYIWGAQLEQASTATEYTRNYGGLFPPRFDYDPVTLAPKGLLIEEQRTNLVVRSEEFNNGAWIKNNVAVTANAIVAPDGNVTAELVSSLPTTTSQFVRTGTVTLTASTNYAFSLYIKNNNSTAFWVRILNGPGTATLASCVFNPTNNSVSSILGFTATPTFQNVGNGWYRFNGSFPSGTDTTAVVYLYPSNALDTSQSAYLWGAQVEAGAFATSYIPTVASQVTRSADVATIQAPNFAPWYNQTQGTFVAEYSSYASTNASTSKGIFGASDGTTNNRLYPNVNTSGTVSFFVAVGNVAQANISTVAVIADGAVAKFAGAYATDNFAAVINGGTVGTDTSGTVPSVDRLSIGGLNGFSQIAGHIRSIRYYPVRLTNAQLQALTA